MLKLSKKLILLIFIVVNSFSLANQTSYTAYTEQEIKSLFNSNTRLFTSLVGTWQRSIDGENWSNFYLPYSEENEEVIYYQKNIKVSKNLIDNNTLHLQFLGFDSNVEIYLNNQLVEKVIGGMIPFSVVLPNRLINSEVLDLKLKIYDAQAKTRQIRYNTLYSKKSYSGLIREVVLIATPKVWISDIKYNVKFSESYNNAKLSISTKISSSNLEKKSSKINDSTFALLAKKTFTATAQLINKQTGAVVATSDAKQFKIESERTVIEKFDLDVNEPQLWSPEQANLYDLKIIVNSEERKLDELSSEIGLRDFKILNIGGKDKFLLNGKQFDVKGINYIEDYSFFGQTLSNNRIVDDLKAIKTLGANIVRVKYSSPNPYFIHTCNALGLLVLVDLPVYDLPKSLIGSNEIQVYLSNIADRLVNAYETSPSVVAWGISSGFEEQTDEFELYKNKINSKLKRSTSKLVYKTINYGLKDFETNDVDFICIQNNQRITSFENLKKSTQELIAIGKSKAIVVSGGAIINPKNNNGYADRLSLEFQAFYIKSIFNISKELDLAGCIIADFNDYKLNSPLLFNNTEAGMYSTAGLFDEYRRERPAYKTLIALFNNEKEPLMAAGNYTEITPVVYISVGLFVFVIIGILLNRYRRFREYFKRSITRPYNFFSDIRDRRILPSFQTLVLSICISITLAIFFSALLYYYRRSDLANAWLNLLLPSNSLKLLAYKLIWLPELMLVMLSIFFMLLLTIISLIIRIVCYFLRLRVYMQDAFLLVIWSSIPLLFVLPFGIVLMKILSLSSVMTSIMLLFMCTVLVWSLGRVMKSTAIVMDKPRGMVYLSGLGFLFIIIGSPIAYYQVKYSFIDFATFIVNNLMRM